MRQSINTVVVSVNKIIGEIVSMVLAHAHDAQEVRGWPEVFDLANESFPQLLRVTQV